MHLRKHTLLLVFIQLWNGISAPGAQAQTANPEQSATKKAALNTAQDYLERIEGHWEGTMTITGPDGTTLRELFIIKDYHWDDKRLRCTTVFEENGSTHITREILSASSGKLMRKVESKKKPAFYIGNLDSNEVVWLSEKKAIERMTREYFVRKEDTWILRMEGEQIAVINGQKVPLKLERRLEKGKGSASER